MYPRHFAARFFISLALFLWPLSPPLKHFLLILLRAISQATNIVNFAVRVQVPGTRAIPGTLRVAQ